MRKFQPLHIAVIFLVVAAALIAMRSETASALFGIAEHDSQAAGAIIPIAPYCMPWQELDGNRLECTDKCSPWQEWDGATCTSKCSPGFWWFSGECRIPPERILPGPFIAIPHAKNCSTNDVTALFHVSSTCVGYTLNWGDGTKTVHTPTSACSPYANNAGSELTHQYATTKPRVYILKLTAPGEDLNNSTTSVAVNTCY